MARRSYRSAEQWQTLIAQFDGSDLNAELFCQQHELGLKSFHHWCYQFSAHIKRRVIPHAFVELKPTPPVLLCPAVLSLHLGTDMRLDFPPNMPTEQLFQLLKAVARA